MNARFEQIRHPGRKNQLRIHNYEFVQEPTRMTHQKFCGQLAMVFNLEKAREKEMIVLILGAFITLSLVKAVLSIRFQSPWLMPDEFTYGIAARDIFGTEHWGLPLGYPLLISIAYLPSDNMFVVYHIMLVINSFLSSSIIFPAYFILYKYCNREFAFMGAITIATLPSLTLYTFLVVTENLFVPLFVFSIWFLLEAYETKKPIWIILAISSVIFLFYTRHTGIIMMASMMISFAYYATQVDEQRYSIKRMPNIFLAIIFLTIIAVSMGALGLILTGTSNFYFKWFHNRIVSDGQIILNIFGDADNLMHFMALMQNEIGYIIIASYFIFFFLAILLFCQMFFASTRGILHSPLFKWYNSMEIKNRRSLKSVSVYFLVSSAIIIPATTVTTYRENWEIIGRYIDPIVPGICLFGLIGLYQIYENKRRPNFRLSALLAAIFSLIFFFRFPFLTANIIAINYINVLKNLAPNWILFPALTAGFFLLLNMYKRLDDRGRLFFIFIIAFSAGASAYTYHADLGHNSDLYNSQNQIGEYLNAHSEIDIPIIMDRMDYYNDIYMYRTVEFWSRRPIWVRPVDEDLAALEIHEGGTYLITSKVLPFDPLAESSRGYYLYKLYKSS